MWPCFSAILGWRHVEALLALALAGSPQVALDVFKHSARALAAATFRTMY